MLLNYFHRHSKKNILHHVSKHFHFEVVQKQPVSCAYHNIIKNYMIKHIYQTRECHNINAVDTSKIF